MEVRGVVKGGGIQVYLEVEVGFPTQVDFTCAHFSAQFRATREQLRGGLKLLKVGEMAGVGGIKGV